MTSQELTKLKEIPALTDSDCSSGESDHEQSESEESQDDEEDVRSGLGKAQDDDEVRLHSFESVQSSRLGIYSNECLNLLQTFMSDTEDSSTSSSQSFGKSVGFAVDSDVELGFYFTGFRLRS